MTLERYAELAARTSRKEPGFNHLNNGILGMIGETGEVVDAVKKWQYQSSTGTPLPVCKLIEELGDVMWYVAEFCAAINEKLGELPVREPFCGCDTVEETAVNLMRDVMALVIDGQETSRIDIITLIARVSYMLEEYCNVSLSDCLNVNIAKLKKRYPDGFDAERSENRDSE